ncbi:17987_t:CDS:1, partial [Cetraspora pellucida]
YQQQLEEMFNKYNIKTHPNMINEVQEARLLLSNPSKLKVSFDNKDLKIIQKKQTNIIENIQEKLSDATA